KKLNPIKNAYINSDKACLEGTRVQIIAKTSQWILNTENDVSQTFLLCGAAGTGKSSISHAIGKKFKENSCLGVFFSFDRTVLKKRTPIWAVQTIAYDLGIHVPEFGKALINKLEEDPGILCDPSL
ncbi:hypothetical protein GYMLUDRAFT_977661, partial [Collybiopsis luxurians FD-317 M1]